MLQPYGTLGFLPIADQSMDIGALSSEVSIGNLFALENVMWHRCKLLRASLDFRVSSVYLAICCRIIRRWPLLDLRCCKPRHHKGWIFIHKQNVGLCVLGISCIFLHQFAGFSPSKLPVSSDIRKLTLSRSLSTGVKQIQRPEDWAPSKPCPTHCRQWHSLHAWQIASGHGYFVSASWCQMMPSPGHLCQPALFQTGPYGPLFWWAQIYHPPTNKDFCYPAKCGWKGIVHRNI